MNAASRLSALILGLPLVFACGGDNLTLPSEGRPARIRITQGNEQTGPVNTELGLQLIAEVTDGQGRPVSGTIVEFVVQEDAGGGTVSPATDTTDAAGQVTATIRLGTEVGALTGVVQLAPDQGATPAPASFIATSFAAGANTLSKVSGDGQEAPVNSPLLLPLIVKVADEFENPIPGVTINWVAEGGGAVGAPTSVTLDNGEASVTRTLGPSAGEQRTVATAELNGAPVTVTFTHTAKAGNVSSVNIVSGNGQEAPAGSKLPQPLVVRLLDEDGNPIVDRPVSWVVGAGGGTADPATSNTGADGQASTTWTLGPTPGSNTLNAVVSGLSPATFTATGTGAGSPSNLALTTQPPASVTAGATLSPGPVVQIRDNAGHDLAVPGVEVTVSVSSGRGQLEGTRTVATDGNGRAAFNDLRITGASGSHRLIFAADGYRSVTSNRIEVEKASTTVTVTDDPDPTNPGEPVTVSVTVSSPAGTPTGEVEISANGSPSCKVAAPQGTCQVTPTSSGDITATYKGSDVFGSSSGTTSHQVNEPPPPPVNNPPVAQPDAYQTPAGQPLSVDAPGLLANDTDPEGGTMTARAETQPAQGGLVIVDSTGSFLYFPGSASGQDTFTYSVSDGTNSSTATVTITIQ